MAPPELASPAFGENQIRNLTFDKNIIGNETSF